MVVIIIASLIMLGTIVCEITPMLSLRIHPDGRTAGCPDGRTLIITQTHIFSNVSQKDAHLNTSLSLMGAHEVTPGIKKNYPPPPQDPLGQIGGLGGGTYFDAQVINDIPAHTNLQFHGGYLILKLHVHT